MILVLVRRQPPEECTLSDSQCLLDPAVSSGDFKRVLELNKQRQLTDSEIYHLLTHHFKPSSTYRFPLFQCGKQNRSFQYSWLSRYNGLVYSELDKGGYCKYCVLFGQCAYSVTSFVGVLVCRPLTNFQKASSKLREHFEGRGTGNARKYHLDAVEVGERFRAVMESKVIPIDQQLWNARAITIEKNKQKLRSIADTVLFCGRQGIPLRGHRDDWKHIDVQSHSNPGNFVALLHFKMQSGDKVLADHLASCGRHSLYTSKTTQNELIEIYGSIIRHKLISRIQAAGMFSVMADEPPSEYFKHQLTIPALDYLRSEISERFSSSSSTILSQIMKLLPVSVADCKEDLTSADIEELCLFYKDDLPAPSSIHTSTELHCWSVKWKGNIDEGRVIDTPLKALGSTDRDFFPNISQIFFIASTLSVTSAECERSVSRLRYLKTYLRSTMLEERLNGLALMYVHRDIPCSPEEVVDKFARLRPRRLELVNPFEL